MNDHGRFRELAAAALDFRLDAVEAGELAAHLRACTDCRRFAADVRADQDLIHRRAAVHAPNRVREAVVDRARGATRRPGVGRLLPLAAAVIVALALLARSAGLVGPQVAGPRPLSPMTWTRLGPGSGLDGGLVTDLANAGSTLVGVGAGITSQGLADAALVWVSGDGVTWTRPPSDPAFAGAAALNVVVHGDKVLVLGVEPAPVNDLLPLRTPITVDSPLVYRAWLINLAQLCAGCAKAGNPWQTTSIEVTQAGASTSFYADAVATDAGFILVGALYPAPMSPHGLTEPIGALIATSPDGLTWTFNNPMAREFSSGSIQGVSDGPGGLVAVGDVALAPAIWMSSPDGGTWTRIAGAITSPGASVRAIASSPDGYVAVGDDGGSARSWVSTDGRSWTGGVVSPDMAGTRMVRVQWLGDEFVAEGTADDGAGIAWRSADGVTWSRVDPGFTFGVLETAGRVGSRELLFGGDKDGTAVAVGEP